MKRLLIATTLILTFLTATSAAAEQYAVVIGTYTSKENADRQLRSLESHFANKPELVALQEANGFDYVNESAAGYHVVSIKPIEGQEALDRIYGEAMVLFPDLYVARVGSFTAIEYHTAGTDAVPAAAAAPAAKPEPAPAPAAAPEALSQPQKEVPEAAVEPAKQVPAPAPVKAAKPAPAAPAAGMDLNGMLLYLGAGAGGLIVLLLLVALLSRKGKKPAAAPVMPIAEEEAEPAVSESDETEAEAAEEVPLTEMEEELPEEVLDLDTEEEIYAEAEEPEPVSEEVPETAAEADVESFETFEEAEVFAPVTYMEPSAGEGSSRKKRSYKRGTDLITKESFSLFAGVRILVAEDNMINQKVIAGLLADTGIELTMANDGQEALDILENDQGFQVVLMDAHMPVMDGFEASRAIRANPLFDAIPVIALSGDTGADDIRKMMEAGMEEHLEKPLHMDALFEKLYNYCEFELEEEEPEEEIELLPDTPELHAEKGLDISMGDEALYREILNEFAGMYADSDETLHDFMIRDQIGDANALLLDVHGIAANIGADRLAETADRLREALMNRDEKEYGALYDAYASHLKAVLADIKKV